MKEGCDGKEFAHRNPITRKGRDMTPEHDTGRPDSARAARKLLVRTAELPRSRRQLFAILREYRTALHAFATQPGISDRPA